jgi:sec-independent protein translocase protein TatA
MTTLTTLLASIMGLGPGELVIILIILLVLFGGSKLPGLAKGIGQSMKEFKKASKDEEPEAKPAAVAPAPAPVVEIKKAEPVKTHGSN